MAAERADRCRAPVERMRAAVARCCNVLGCACVLLACASERPSAHAVVVSQAGSNSLALIDPEAGRVLKTLSVGALPHRLVRTRAGDTFYAVLVGSQAVAEIDARSFSLRRTLLTAPVPAERADGSVIEAHAEENAFEHTSCFDCHRPEGAKPLVVGERPVGIALSADERRLYVSHIRGARLSVIELSSGRLSYSEPLQPTAAAVEAADLVRVREQLVVALRPTQPSTDPGAVRFLDAESFEQQAEFASSSDPASLTPLPDRGSVLVSHFDTDRITELAATHEPRSFQVSPGPLGALQLADPRHALALDYYSNALSWLDLDTADVTQLPLQLGAESYVNPTHAALSPDGQRAYVVSSGTDGHLLLVDVRARKLVSAIAIDGLSFDVLVIPSDA